MLIKHADRRQAIIWTNAGILLIVVCKMVATFVSALMCQAVYQLMGLGYLRLYSRSGKMSTIKTREISKSRDWML